MTALLSLVAHTCRELVRNKLLYLLIVFSALMIFGSILLATLTIGQWARIMNNVGLTTVQLAGTLVSVLVGVGLVAGEMERRTLYVVLAKPVSRTKYLVGRYLGLGVSLAVLVGLMGALIAGVLGATDYPMTSTGVYALLLIYVELLMLSAFAVVFSAFTTPTLGVMFTLSLFVLGHLASDLDAVAHKIGGTTGSILSVAGRIVPNLDLLNLKSQAANALPVEPAFVAGSVVYGLAYSAVAVAFAAWLFQRRDLK